MSASAVSVFGLLALLAAPLFAQSTGPRVIDFDTVPLPQRNDHGPFYNGADGVGGLTLDGVHFNNRFTDFGGGVTAWSGWSVARSADTTTPGFGNQYSSFAGGGVAGSQPGAQAGQTAPASADSQFAVAFNSVRGEAVIQFDAPVAPVGFYVTNGTYAALSMRLGDAFAKRFGGVSGTDPDFFRLDVVGIDAAGRETGQVEFYLADFRSSDPAEDVIVDRWTWLDLSPLGRGVQRLEFALASSDVGPFGMNTPAYFLIDNLAFRLPPRGDVNGDGLVDVADVNLLIRHIDLGTVEGNVDRNEDGRVDLQDLRVWVHDERITWFGDANLDGQFDSSDLVQVFQRGQYEDAVADNSGWDAGDWNADREADSADLVLAFQDGGFERGARGAVVPVPEPCGTLGWMVALGWVGVRWRRSVG